MIMPFILMLNSIWPIRDRVPIKLKSVVKYQVVPGRSKRQKGTGTARAGNIRNPLFRGGGRIFGPRPRNYGFKLNKKVKQLARKSAFHIKL